MEVNYLAIIISALVPKVMGLIWYNPRLFGTAWMKASGMTQKKLETSNLPVIMGVSFLFALLLSFFIGNFVVHQNGFYALFASHPDMASDSSELFKYVMNFKEKYDHLHRSFGHGALHGGIFGFFAAFPLIGRHALYERKGWKYIFINVGYWFITAMIMGGILSVWR